VEENQEGKGFEWGRLENIFQEEKETTENLEKKMEGFRELRFLLLW
jgi:hypothetical protein